MILKKKVCEDLSYLLSQLFNYYTIALSQIVQVAEMHGELLEFNEGLQRSVQSRDVAISRLVRF